MDAPKYQTFKILTPEQLERKLEPDSHYSIAYTLESRKSMLDAYRTLYAEYKQGKRLLDEAIHDGTRTADALNERVYNMLAAEKQRIGELEWKIKGYELDRIALVYEIDRLRKELRTLTTKE
jgi:chromosome segregation ATPase